MNDILVRQTTERLGAPSAALLRDIATAASTTAEHHRLAKATGVFDVLEAKGTAGGAPLPDTFRVSAWNGERVKFAEASADLVRRSGVDVLFLTEADVGMARSGNRHTAADLASALGMNYVFGVEFLELGLGDEREQMVLEGQANRFGFHGNALLAKTPILDPFVLRLDDGGVWWREVSKGQKRLGWRMAVCGWIELGGMRVLLASIHLESKTDPADRAAQTERLVRHLAEIAGFSPILIGGDFNTKTLVPGEGDRSWFDCADEHEPLFRHLRSAGFTWRDGNTVEATQRPSRTSEPTMPYARLDWIFARGLEASSPFTVPALDADNRALSDHELVVADYRRST